MYAEKVFELIKELERYPDNIPAFNDEVLREVFNEINLIFNENHKDAVACSTLGDRSLVPLLGYRHASLQRNKRCILAYLYNRLQRIKEMRWQFGSIIPPDIRNMLCEPEIQWFNAYSKNLAQYMLSISNCGSSDGQMISCGINLIDYQKPPKSLYIEVRCLEDYGKFELDGGEVILLKKHSQHYLPRIECEALIRQGILQHIV